MCLYRSFAERKFLDASLSDFSSNDFHLDLKSRAVVGSDFCACNAIEPGGFDNTRSNGAKAVEVWGLQLYAYVIALVYKSHSRG